MNLWTERLLWQAWSWMFRGRRRYKLAMAVVKMGIRTRRFCPGTPTSWGMDAGGAAGDSAAGQFPPLVADDRREPKPADRNTP